MHVEAAVRHPGDVVGVADGQVQRGAYKDQQQLTGEKKRPVRNDPLLEDSHPCGESWVDDVVSDPVPNTLCGFLKQPSKQTAARVRLQQ